MLYYWLNILRVLQLRFIVNNKLGIDILFSARGKKVFTLVGDFHEI